MVPVSISLLQSSFHCVNLFEALRQQTLIIFCFPLVTIPFRKLTITKWVFLMERKFSVDSPTRDSNGKQFPQISPKTQYGQKPEGLLVVSFRVNDYAAFAAFGERLNRGTWRSTLYIIIVIIIVINCSNANSFYKTRHSDTGTFVHY